MGGLEGHDRVGAVERVRDRLLAEDVQAVRERLPDGLFVERLGRGDEHSSAADVFRMSDDAGRHSPQLDFPAERSARESAAGQRFALFVAAARVSKSAEVVVDVCEARVIGTVSFLEDGERAAVGAFAFVEATRILVEHPQLVEHRRDLNIFGTERLFGQRKGIAQRRPSLFVPARRAVVVGFFAKRPDVQLNGFRIAGPRV